MCEYVVLHIIKMRLVYIVINEGKVREFPSNFEKVGIVVSAVIGWQQWVSFTLSSVFSVPWGAVNLSFIVPFKSCV